MARKERFSRIGHYILKGTLGSGSFGKVKLAVDEHTGEHYACKIIEKDIVKEHTLLKQVQKEIHIMRNLQHRNTVSLVAVLASASKIFILMDLVTGGELFDEIRRNRRLSEPYARFYFRQLIDGLQYCHDHGVYHRDLKPENLLLEEDHTLKITDFGLSSLKGNKNVLTTSLTKSSLLHTQCGTPNYVAPEIITMGATGYSGALVDAWSCGIILYVLVAEDLRDLISNLLKIKPSERYSLTDVKRHPWYTNPDVSDTNNLPDDEDAYAYDMPLLSRSGFGARHGFSRYVDQPGLEHEQGYEHGHGDEQSNNQDPKSPIMAPSADDEGDPGSHSGQTDNIDNGVSPNGVLDAPEPMQQYGQPSVVQDNQMYSGQPSMTVADANHAPQAMQQYNQPAYIPENQMLPGQPHMAMPDTQLSPDAMQQYSQSAVVPNNQMYSGQPQLEISDGQHAPGAMQQFGQPAYTPENHMHPGLPQAVMPNVQHASEAMQQCGQPSVMPDHQIYSGQPQMAMPDAHHSPEDMQQYGQPPVMPDHQIHSGQPQMAMPGAHHSPEDMQQYGQPPVMPDHQIHPGHPQMAMPDAHHSPEDMQQYGQSAYIPENEMHPGQPQLVMPDAHHSPEAMQQYAQSAAIPEQQVYQQHLTMTIPNAHGAPPETMHYGNYEFQLPQEHTQMATEQPPMAMPDSHPAPEEPKSGLFDNGVKEQDQMDTEPDLPPSYGSVVMNNDVGYSDQQMSDSHYTTESTYNEGPSSDEDDDDDLSHEETQALDLTGRPYGGMSKMGGNSSTPGFGQRRVMSTNDLTKHANDPSPQTTDFDSLSKFDDQFQNVRTSRTRLADVQRQMWNRDANSWRPQWDAHSFENQTTDSAAVHTLRIEKMADDVNRAFIPKGKRDADGGDQTNGDSSGKWNTKLGGMRKINSNPVVHHLLAEKSNHSSLDGVEGNGSGGRVASFGPHPLRRSLSHDGRMTIQPLRRKSRRASKKPPPGNSLDCSISRPSSFKEDSNSSHSTDQNQENITMTTTMKRAETSQKRVKHSKRNTRGANDSFPSGRRTKTYDGQAKKKGKAVKSKTNDVTVSESSGAQWVESMTDKMVWTTFMRDYDMIPDEIEFGYNSKELNDMWETALVEAGLVKKGQFWDYIYHGNDYNHSRSTQFLSNNSNMYPNTDSSRRDSHQRHSKQQKQYPDSGSHNKPRRTKKTVNFVDEPKLHRLDEQDTDHSPPMPAKPRRSKTGSKKGNVRFATHSSPSSDSGVRNKLRSKRSASKNRRYDHEANGNVNGNDAAVSWNSSSDGYAMKTARSSSPQDSVTTASESDVKKGRSSTVHFLTTDTDDTISRHDSTYGGMTEGDTSPTDREGYSCVDNGNISDVSNALSSSSRTTMKSNSHTHFRSVESATSLNGVWTVQPATSGSEHDPYNNGTALDDHSHHFEQRDDTLSQVDEEGSHRAQTQDLSRRMSSAHSISTQSSRSVYPSPRSVRGMANLPYTSRDSMSENTDAEMRGSKSLPMSSPSREDTVTVDKSPSKSVDRKTRDIKENDRNINGSVKANQLHALGDNSNSINTDNDGDQTKSNSDAAVVTESTAVNNVDMDQHPQHQEGKEQVQYEESKVMTHSPSVSPFQLDIPAPKGLAPPSRNSLLRMPMVTNLLRKDPGIPLPGRAGSSFQSLLRPADSYEVMTDALKAYGCDTRQVRRVWMFGDRWKIRCEWTGLKGRPRKATVVMCNLDPDGLSVVLMRMRHRVGDGAEEEFQSFYDSVREMYCERANQFHQRRRNVAAREAGQDSNGSGSKNMAKRHLGLFRAALTKRNRRMQWTAGEQDEEEDEDEGTEAQSSVMRSSSGRMSGEVHTHRDTPPTTKGGRGGGDADIRSDEDEMLAETT